MGNGKLATQHVFLKENISSFKTLLTLMIMQTAFLLNRNKDPELTLFREIEKLKEELRVRRESEDQMKQVFCTTRQIFFSFSIIVILELVMPNFQT